MTPDLQARIEREAKSLAAQTVGGTVPKDHPTWEGWIASMVFRLVVRCCSEAIAEKDAEAAEFREFVNEIASLNMLDRYGEDLTIDAARKLLSSTAGRDTLAELASLRERVRELEGALNLPREQLAMLSRPMQSITITPEGE